MRLGIDFGTTRIVVASVDRGNYPVVTFEGPDGEAWEWFPPLAAVRAGERLFGWDAWTAQEDPQATIVRSIKRFLQDAGPQTTVQIGSQSLSMLDLLCGITNALRKGLLEDSSLTIPAGEPIEVMLGVPANANGNQRFLTVEAFRRAGFLVTGLLNEPTAASVEFGHAHRKKQPLHSGDAVLVYDLGGGTFDASLVVVEQKTHTVVASEGISTLGGDDFDEILAEMALEGAGLSVAEREALSQAEWFWLHEECRRQKENLHPNTRRIVVDVDVALPHWDPVSVPVKDYYQRCQPRVEETIQAVSDLLAAHALEVKAIYVTGGASELPLVSRALREAFGKRVRRATYTRSATAIGLAIQADAHAGYQLREQFTRNFGVWREGDAGRTFVFDPLFLKGTPLATPGQTPLEVSRRYHPAHNIGHFRYLECSHRGEDGRPIGDITLWDEILFPFEPALGEQPDLAAIPVTRSDSAPLQEVEEAYLCDASGSVTVTISNNSAGYRRSYQLGRWAPAGTPVVPGKRKKTKTAGGRAS